MQTRTAFVATSVLALLVTLYLLRSASSPSRTSSTSPSTASPLMLDNLKVRLQLRSTDPPTIQVVVKNDSPSTTFTVFTWDTPLDDTVLNQSVFKLTDASSGSVVEGPGLKINRLLPPPSDAFVEIAPQSEVTKNLPLAAPWIPKDGKTYNIQAQGSWKAVWAKSLSAVPDEEIKAMSGSDVLMGEFQSDTVEMKLS